MIRKLASGGFRRRDGFEKLDHGLALGGVGGAERAEAGAVSVASAHFETLHLGLERLVAAHLLVEPVRLDEIEERTRKGGGEIVNLMKTSSYYAAGTAAYKMVEAYILDRKEMLPCAAYLEGEYGVQGLYAGVPVIISAAGVERIVEIQLTEAEKKAFASSVGHVRELVEAAPEEAVRARIERSIGSWLAGMGRAKEAA